MRHLAQPAAVQVGDARARRAARADRAAVGAQPADAGLQVDGQKVRKQHGAQHLLLADAQLLRVLDHRHGGRDALVAAAGDDDHRHLAAAHARVGRSRRHVARAVLNVLPVAVADHLADVRAPGVFHALLGYGVVVGDLLPHQFAHVRKVAAVRKVADDRDAQNAPVGQAAVCVASLAVFKQHLTVSLDQDDVRG